MTPAVIFDMDGTLANCAHRRHHITGEGKKNWAAFNALMGDDPPNHPVCELAHTLSEAGYAILVVSGRDEKFRAQTEMWMTFNAVPWTELHMRPLNDGRPDTDIKREILAQLRPRFNIRFVVDDRDRLVKMWREEGLCCLQCAEGDF